LIDLQNSSTAARSTNFQQNPCYATHHTLSMLLHYLGKLKNQRFALCMHIKHVSSVTFYHLSKRYPPNVMKISANISTIQNLNILLFMVALWNRAGHYIFVLWFLSFFYLFTALCNAVLAMAFPSVCPSVSLSVRPFVHLSVRHTPVLCQNDGT